jgi:exopolysaccharide biosynthesis WecB/TagA/CpsF family protein
MIDGGKKNILGVCVDAVDYQAAVSRIIEAGLRREPFAVSTLAVHGVMTGALDRTHRFRLNSLDLVAPDGQPVRWALNWLHHAGLSDRVYGPLLMLKVCERAAERDLPVYLYGSRPEVVSKLEVALRQRYPRLKIAGSCPSQFRRLTQEEDSEVMRRIQDSGARIVFVGLGCPRQEVWVYEHRNALPMPLIAVGAAFDFHAGTLPQAPAWMQRVGLEWLFRLICEPRRLWKRYLLLNPAYVGLLFLQWSKLHVLRPSDGIPPGGAHRGG